MLRLLRAKRPSESSLLRMRAPREADFTDLDAVGSALERLASDAAPIVPLRTIGSGWFSVAVETASGNVFRLACTEEVTARHRKEASLLPWLAPHLPLSIPGIRWCIRAASDPALPFGGVGYPKLPGEPAADLSRFTPGQRRRLITDLAAFLVALHRVHVPNAMTHGAERPEARGLEDFFRGVRDDSMPALRNRVEPPFYSLVEQWWREFLEDPAMTDHPWVLTHGDISGSNLLVDPATNGLGAVIDWEHAQISDPARDFFELVDLGWDFVDELIDEYTALGGSLGSSGRYRIRRRAQVVMFYGIRRAYQRHDDYWMERDIEQLRERLTAPAWT